MLSYVKHFLSACSAASKWSNGGIASGRGLSGDRGVVYRVWALSIRRRGLLGCGRGLSGLPDRTNWNRRALLFGLNLSLTAGNVLPSLMYIFT